MQTSVLAQIAGLQAPSMHAGVNMLKRPSFFEEQKRFETQVNNPYDQVGDESSKAYSE